MNKLARYSNEELLAELASRNDKAPIPLENPDFTKLIKLVIDYVENNDGVAEDDDTEHYIFEQAVDAVYGLGIWNYLNKRNIND